MWFQDDFIMVVKIAFETSVNRCKTCTYNDFSLYIRLHSNGYNISFKSHHSVKFSYINCYTK